MGMSDAISRQSSTEVPGFHPGYGAEAGRIGAGNDGNVGRGQPKVPGFHPGYGATVRAMAEANEIKLPRRA
jgi:hypothetical protein